MIQARERRIVHVHPITDGATLAQVEIRRLLLFLDKRTGGRHPKPKPRLRRISTTFISATASTAITDGVEVYSKGVSRAVARPEP